MKDFTRLVSDKATTRKISKNKILLFQGDIPQHVSIVQSGCIKVYRISNEGDEKVFGFKTAGDIFPECWSFGNSSNTMYCYESIENSTILNIDREVFLESLRNSPSQGKEWFDYLVRNYTGLMIQITALEQSHAADKILMILYYMMIRHGEEGVPGEFKLLMKLRQATIAGLTGLTRETVTSEMGKLKKIGVVKYGRDGFVIYKEPLKNLLGEETFMELQFN